MLSSSDLSIETTGHHPNSNTLPNVRVKRTKKARTSFNVISDSEDSPPCLPRTVTRSPTEGFSTCESRARVSHDYHDHVNEQDPDEAYYDTDEDDEESQSSGYRHKTKGPKRRGPRGGVAVPFPEKLHLMLSNVEKDGYDHVVSWQPHGRCFMVHKPKEFVSEVMPLYFRQTKLTSFQRQLNLYGFCRLTSGRDRGAYYHELFLLDRMFLCRRMMRTRIKGTGIKAASSPSTEPDFYKMPFVQPRRIARSVRTKCEDTDVMMESPDAVVSESVSEEAFEPPSFLSANQQPLVMPVLPRSNDSLRNTATPTSFPAPTVTPPQTPQQVQILPPAEVPSDWLLSDSTFLGPEDDAITFEGKTFHYLDSSSFECLDDNKDPLAWISIKETDELFADW